MKNKIKICIGIILGIFMGVMVLDFSYAAYNNSNEFKSATAVSTGTIIDAMFWNEIVGQIGELMDNITSSINTVNSLSTSISDINNSINSINSVINDATNSINTVSGSMGSVNSDVTNLLNSRLGTITNTKWCTASGTLVSCTANVPLLSESDIKTGTHSGNFISKWSSSISQFIDSIIYETGGNVGIGTLSPKTKLDLGGEIKMGITDISCDSNTMGSMRFDVGILSFEYCNGISWGPVGRWYGTGVTPQGLSFGENKTLASLMQAYESSTVILTGFDKPLSVNCTNCYQIAKNGIWYTVASLAGFMPGDSVAVKIVSSQFTGTTITGNISIGNVNTLWSVTTTDQDFSGTKSLYLDFDDSFDDKSTNPKTVTKYGLPMRMDGRLFGGKSLYLNGQANNYLQISDSSDFDFGAGDFTIDTWINVTQTSGLSNAILGKRISLGGVGNYNGWAFWVADGTRPQFAVKIGGVYIPDFLTGSTILPAYTWHHIAIVRNGNNFFLFVNGKLEGTKTNSGLIDNYAGNLSIGSSTSGFENGCTGYIDNMRIIKGAALWTAPFNPVATITPEKTFTCGDAVPYDGGPCDEFGRSCTDGVVDGYYGTMKIGDQCWMKHNMNAGTKVGMSWSNQTNNGVIEKFCRNDDSSLCNVPNPGYGIYPDGGYYKWAEAIQYAKGLSGCTASDSSTCQPLLPTQGICPSGWHIPSDLDFNILENYLTNGSCELARSTNDDQCRPIGTLLRTGGPSGLELNLIGFMTDPDGSPGNPIYGYWLYGGGANLISSTVSNGGTFISRNFNNGVSGNSRGQAAKWQGYSVRCLKDSPISTRTKDGMTQSTAGKSCYTIKNDGYSIGNGIYWLDPDDNNDTSNAFQAYCDMTNDGGGWTLVFGYNSSTYWTSSSGAVSPDVLKTYSGANTSYGKLSDRNINLLKTAGINGLYYRFNIGNSPARGIGNCSYITNYSHQLTGDKSCFWSYDMDGSSNAREAAPGHYGLYTFGVYVPSVNNYYFPNTWLNTQNVFEFYTGSWSTGGNGTGGYIWVR